MTHTAHRWSPQLLLLLLCPLAATAADDRLAPLLRGEVGAFGELLRGCPDADWPAEARQVAEAAKSLPDPKRYDTALAALKLLGALHGRDAEGAVTALQWLPRQPRDALAGVPARRSVPILLRVPPGNTPRVLARDGAIIATQD